MADEAGLKDAQDFISQYIGSAEQLEVLLLLHAHPERTFTALEVSQQVFTVPASALLRLEELTAAGLLASDGGPDPRYRYAPGSPGLAARVDGLAAAYRADRVAVVRLIFATPTDPLRSFANAFRLKQRGE